MGTVTKALTLLDFFSRQRPEIGLSDLARAAGMNKATVYRMLSELQALGFVEQSGAGRNYRLGPSVLRLAGVREATVPMRDAAQPVLRQLSGATGETAHISQLQGDTLATLAYAYSAAHGTSVRMEDAMVLPFHATSTGLAVLAHADAALLARVLTGPLPALTADTLTDPGEIRARLARIRASGFAELTGGFEADVHSLALPLFDAAGHCTAAVAVAAPATRMTPALRAIILAALAEAAEALVTLWGGVMPEDLAQVHADAV